MEGQLVGRIPPHSLEAEESVLGSMLLQSNAINTAIEMLKTEDFYRKAHAHIFDAIVRLYGRGEPVDMVLLVEELKRVDMLEAVGGVSYIANLSASVISASNIEYYCQIVKDKSILRQLIQGSDKILNEAYKDEEETPFIIERAEQIIFDITQSTHQTGLTHIESVLHSNLERLEKLYADPSALTGLTTGFTDLDRKLSGLQKSDLILLAARPAMGKTALMLNISLNAALEAKAHVAVFSLEMSKEQLTQRLISSLSHVDLQSLISGKLSDEQWLEVVGTLKVLKDTEIYIDDTPGITVTEMKAKCRRLKAEKELDLIVIDYLQLMEGEGRAENRQQEITRISRNLKGMAKELNVPVLALSQLSRAPEKRAGNHRPIMSDLRESGAIEQDADIILMLYRDEVYDENTEMPNIGELIIAKHRNGPTGKIYLTFLSQYTKFADCELQPED